MSEENTECKIVPVILCGGSGTRLWPQSRVDNPKQFLKLMGEHSLLQDTVLRALRISGASVENLVTVTLGDLRDNVYEQLVELYPDVPTHHILCEPYARDTAAAVAFAARYVEQVFGEDAVMWVLPADHYIGDEGAMKVSFDDALETSKKDYLVTFGIRPTRPETGYGYIKLGQELKEGVVYNADSFVEKPDRDTAQMYLDTGQYMWNSGMFMFSAACVLQQFTTYSAALLKDVDDAMEASDTADAVDAAIYAEIPKVPFDKAIMEKSAAVAIVPCDPEWSDIGSWESLWEIREKDENGNVKRGSVFCHETRNCLVQSQTRLIACADVEDIVVIETEDSILIANRKNSDVMKTLVNALKADGRDEVQGIVSLAPALKSALGYNAQEICIGQNEVIGVEGQGDCVLVLTVLQGAAFAVSAQEERVYSSGEAIIVRGDDAKYEIYNNGDEPLMLIFVNQGAKSASYTKWSKSIASVV